MQCDTCWYIPSTSSNWQVLWLVWHNTCQYVLLAAQLSKQDRMVYYACHALFCRHEKSILRLCHIFLRPGTLMLLVRQSDIFIVTAPIPEIMAPLWDTVSLIYSQGLQSTILISFLHPKISIRIQAKIADGMFWTDAIKFRDTGVKWIIVLSPPYMAYTARMPCRV